MTRPAVWIPLLAIAAVFFGWESYKAWTGPVLPGASSPAAATSAPRETAAPEETRSGGTASFSVASIVARPLFRPDRRPYTENGALLPGRNYEAELSRFTVLGVLMLGTEQKAVVTDRAPGGSNRWEVGAGDSLPGFTVKEVREDGISLESDGRIFLLPLYAGGPRSGGGPIRTETPQKGSTTPPPGSRPSPPAAGSSPGRRVERMPPGGIPAVPPGPGGGLRRRYLPGNR